MSTLLDQASLIITPNSYKEGKILSVVPSDGSGDMDFVRATSAIRTNPSGFLEMACYNLAGYSEEFDNSYWTKNNSTVVLSNKLLGIQSYNLIPNNGVSGNIARGGATPQDGNTYLRSIYVRKFGVRYIVLSSIATGSSSTDFRSVMYDLDNKVVTRTGSQIISSGIEDLGDGILRLWQTSNSVNSLFDDFDIGFSSDGTTINSYIGNGIDGVTIFGAQAVLGVEKRPYQATTNRLNFPRVDYTNGTPALLIEPQRTNLYLNSENLVTQNITTIATSYTVSFYGTGTVTFSGTVTKANAEAGLYATSYIPTLASAVTRNADVISKTSVFNASEDFTFFYEGKTINNTTSIYFDLGSLGYLVSIPPTHIFRFRYNATNYLAGASEYFKYVIKKNSTNMKIFMNGVLLHTITTLPTGLVNLSMYVGEVDNLKIWKQALTDAECITLTT